MSSTTEQNKATLRQFFDEVWNEGNIEACDKFLAATYTIRHDPGDPWDKQTLDLEGFKNRVSQSRAPFPDQRFEIQDFIGEGDVVACSWLWKGTHLGPIAGLPPSGKELTMSGMTFYDFTEGRICGHWQVADRLSVFQQLQRFQKPS